MDVCERESTAWIRVGAVFHSLWKRKPDFASMSKLNTHVFLKGICWVVHWEIIFNLGGFGVFFNFSVENVLEESQALVGNHLGWEREAAR